MKLSGEWVKRKFTLEYDLHDVIVLEVDFAPKDKSVNLFLEHQKILKDRFDKYLNNEKGFIFKICNFIWKKLTKKGL